MSEIKVRTLVILSAIFLLMVGAILFFTFKSQSINKNNVNNYISYNIDDYVSISPVIFEEYSDIYSDINVSKVNIINLDKNISQDFINKEEKFIGYITGYYSEIKSSNKLSNINTATSLVKKQINNAILSIFYKIEFNLDKNIFKENIKNYIVTYNVDLGTKKILSNDDLLLKYNYSKRYISEKIFNEDVMIESGQVVIDTNTNMSLTKSEIERRKNDYIDKIVEEFDNIISMYIDNNSLVLVYDKKELRNIFFDNIFDTEIKFRYLK